MSLYQHRLELIQALASNGIEVFMGGADGEEIPLIEASGCKYHLIEIDSRGANPFAELKLLNHIINLIKEIKPDIVLTFYTKTNIYGGIACRILGIPYIENVTGLGTALGGKGLKMWIMKILYGTAIKKAKVVFFQNSSNHLFFEKNKMIGKSWELLPGSGVALGRHKVLPYPTNDKIRFVFISRIIQQKGINEFIESAIRIGKEYPNTEFHIIGPAKGRYLDQLTNLSNQENFFYHGKVVDVMPILKNMHCLVFPSYYPEGMANVLLEAAAAGRPIITTDCPGCRETVEDGRTGFIVKPKDTESLTAAMKKFIELSPSERKAMGVKGREKMEKDFDRSIVIDSYIKIIDKVLRQ